tara:strand:+ start:157 stop:606 length:450 start_codon:yes stop_codon:yes gene_type:complete
MEKCDSDTENEKDLDKEEIRVGTPMDNSFIDDLTLKLLVNQTSYAKYISKTDEQLFEQQQRFTHECDTHRGDILAITKELCNKPYTDNYSSTINDAFNEYAHILLRYIQTKEHSDDNQKEYENENDEMFPYEMNEPKLPTSTLDFFVKK